MKKVVVLVAGLLLASGLAGNAVAGENPIAVRMVVSKPTPQASIPQIARPISTLTVGQWAIAGTDPAPTRHESIDESELDGELTRVQTPSPPNDSHGEYGLSPVPDPLVHTGHIMRVWHRTDGTNNRLDLELVEGSTVIATRIFDPEFPGVYTSSEFELTETEASGINDYGNLRYRLDARRISGVNRAVLVSMAEFQVPGSGAPGAWEALPCDGTDVLDGIGNLRMQGFATATTSSTGKSFKTKYTSGESTAAPWYWTHNPVLIGGVELEVSDVVQDIDPSLPDHDFSFEQVGGQFKGCGFEAFNLPEESEGNKSHRTTAGHYVEEMRVVVAPYANPDNKFVCGDGRTASRLKVQVFATSSVSGDYDFHIHQEMENVIGPNQHGSDIDTRSWEMGMDNIRLPAGVEKLVGTGALSNTVADPVTGEKRTPTRHTFHFGQQTDPTQPLNQVFCASDPIDNEIQH